MAIFRVFRRVNDINEVLRPFRCRSNIRKIPNEFGTQNRNASRNFAVKLCKAKRSCSCFKYYLSYGW